MSTADPGTDVRSSAPGLRAFGPDGPDGASGRDRVRGCASANNSPGAAAPCLRARYTRTTPRNPRAA